MTDHDLEQRLRAFYRAEINDRETAPLQLRTDLATFTQTAARSRRPLTLGWRFSMNRFAPFALAATAIAVALLIGGLLLRPSFDVGPSPSPDTTHSATLEPSATPVATARAAAWTMTGSMNYVHNYGYPRGTATLLLDGTVLVAGGSDPSGALTSAELYDPGTGIWTPTPEDPHVHRDNPTATLLRDGRVLIVGGSLYLYQGPRPNTQPELYDPVSGTWQYTGSMSNDRRTGHTATLLSDGRVLVAGGTGNSPSAELYDPVSGTWSATGNMVEARTTTSATVLPDGRVLVAGSDAGEPNASAELYNPATATWTATGNMIDARISTTATLLPDGTVLVAGGTGANGILASAELYDPASGTWTATSSMGMNRALFTATLLRDGKVLVAGGARESGLGAPAELYDPATRTWTRTANLDVPRARHTATLLLDGSVLLAGGLNGIDGSVDLTSAEVYDPGSGN
ncbi:MAG: kelch repeat-containing protein [Candidatus Limnocylindrales bacterium]